jgi:hypothetical protein
LARYGGGRGGGVVLIGADEVDVRVLGEFAGHSARFIFVNLTHSNCRLEHSYYPRFDTISQRFYTDRARFTITNNNNFDEQKC